MFFQSMLYLHFYTNFLGHERRNFKINYYCTRLITFNQPVLLSSYKQLCVNGSCYGLYKQSYTHTFALQNKSNLLHYFRISSDITLFPLYIIMVSFMQPKFHNVNTNPKLRLQCNVGTKYSPVKFGKTLTFRQNIYTYLYGVLAGTTKMNLKCEDILN